MNLSELPVLPKLHSSFVKILTPYKTSLNRGVEISLTKTTGSLFDLFIWPHKVYLRIFHCIVFKEPYFTCWTISLIHKNQQSFKDLKDVF